MSTFTYDRYALGIVMKDQWTDADNLAQVGAAVGKLSLIGVDPDLPSGDNVGVAALRQALENFRDYMSPAVLECSDACSELGSGAADFAQDADETESYNYDKARAAAANLGVERF